MSDLPTRHEGVIQIPLGTENTWTDLTNNSGPGEKIPTEKERYERGDPVKRSGYPR